MGRRQRTDRKGCEVEVEYWGVGWERGRGCWGGDKTLVCNIFYSAQKINNNKSNNNIENRKQLRIPPQSRSQRRFSQRRLVASWIPPERPPCLFPPDRTACCWCFPQLELLPHWQPLLPNRRLLGSQPRTGEKRSMCWSVTCTQFDPVSSWVVSAFSLWVDWVLDATSITLNNNLHARHLYGKKYFSYFTASLKIF